MIGKKVAVLENKQKPTGTHTIEWKPENIGAGIYFIRLETKQGFLIRKVIISG